MNIYLTRHSETIRNVRNWVQGMTDIPLNDNGLQQTEHLAAGMAGVHLDEVYTAQPERAMITGKTVADRHKDCRFEMNESLKEMNFGIYEGKVRTDAEYLSEVRKYFKTHEGGGE